MLRQGSWRTIAARFSENELHIKSNGFGVVSDGLGEDEEIVGWEWSDMSLEDNYNGFEVIKLILRNSKQCDFLIIDSSSSKQHYHVQT